MPIPSLSEIKVIPPKRVNKNARRDEFIRHYIECGNGAESARRAGYSPIAAPAQACRLLKDPIVQTAIAKQRNKSLKIEYLDGELLSIIANCESDKVKVDAIRVGYQRLGALTEKRINESTVKHIQDNLSDIPTDRLQSTLIERLRLSSEGITPKSDSLDSVHSTESVPANVEQEGQVQL